jgi:hypothetical protein
LNIPANVKIDIALQLLGRLNYYLLAPTPDQPTVSIVFDPALPPGTAWCPRSRPFA